MQNLGHLPDSFSVFLALTGLFLVIYVLWGYDLYDVWVKALVSPVLDTLGWTLRYDYYVVILDRVL